MGNSFFPGKVGGKTRNLDKKSGNLDDKSGNIDIKLGKRFGGQKIVENVSQFR